MEISAVSAAALFLMLAVLALAPIAIARSPLKQKTAIQILGGIAAGFVAGLALGALSNDGPLAAHLGFLMMWCGGLGVTVYKLRRARHPNPPQAADGSE